MRFLLLLFAIGLGTLAAAETSPPDPLAQAEETGKLTYSLTKEGNAIIQVASAADLDDALWQYMKAHPKRRFLIRVKDGEPTHFESQFAAPNVYLINPAGILFGPKSLLDPTQPVSEQLKTTGEAPNLP